LLSSVGQRGVRGGEKFERIRRTNGEASFGREFQFARRSGEEFAGGTGSAAAKACFQLRRETGAA
jgi:hypothetical protein